MERRITTIGRTNYGSADSHRMGGHVPLDRARAASALPWLSAGRHAMVIVGTAIALGYEVDLVKADPRMRGNARTSTAASQRAACGQSVAGS
jgi:hypothetical protein